MRLQSVTLTHGHARLEPLTLAHFDDLARFIEEESLWVFMSFGGLETPEKLRAWMEKAIQEPETGTGLPFAIVDTESGTAVGHTSLFDYSPVHRTAEIGRTWIGRPFQRTPINTECKYLLLRHGFETVGCHRIQLKTDSRNLRSQAAIERIGAKKEGILRAHMVLPNGYVRDTVMYSVIAAEWPETRAHLERLMDR
jgi:RimJ/RimL family protein N-acetyltransferase